MSRGAHLGHEDLQGALGVHHRGDVVPALLHAPLVVRVQNLLLEVSDLGAPERDDESNNNNNSLSSGHTKTSS